MNTTRVLRNFLVQPVAFVAVQLALLLTITTGVFAQGLSLLPQPRQVQLTGGELSLRDGMVVKISGECDERLGKSIDRLYGRLSSKLGFVVMKQPVEGTSPATLEIGCDKKGEKVQKVQEDESYSLEVKPAGAVLHAQETLGALRGLETFYQLAVNTPDGFGGLPGVKIQDVPRFPWRGLLFDVARHYITVDQIQREIDGMAAVKMNVLHLHLSDDQSFRVESKKFPQLIEKGSHGEYYTQAQIKDLVAYARDRGIRIVPEFDVPGHSTAWLAAFPELATNKDDVGKPFINFGGYKNNLDPSNPKLLKVLDKLFGEMAGLFPDEYFHIGGDEVNYTYWNDSPSITAFKQKHNLADNRAVQAYFNTQVEKILHKHHKKMVGWNEILHSDLPLTTVVHSWTGVEALQEAVTRGYQVIASLDYYLDWYMPAWFHYEVDPLKPNPATIDYLMKVTPGADKSKRLLKQREFAANFTAPPNAEKLIIGGEAAEWTELATPWTIDSVLWPRMAAIAERLWSPADVNDVNSLYRRFDPLMEELSDLGITPTENLRVLRERLAGSPENERTLRTFIEALEPVKYYTRNQRERRSGNYRINGQYNRLVDTTPAESPMARRFSLAVAQVISTHSPANIEFLDATLQRWRANDAKVVVLIKSNPRLSEVAPLEESLVGVMSAASEALMYLRRGQQAPAWWVAAQHTVLDAAGGNAGDLQLAIREDVRKLVDAAGSAGSE
jgi:hexosaminidase